MCMTVTPAMGVGGVIHAAVASTLWLSYYDSGNIDDNMQYHIMHTYSRLWISLWIWFWLWLWKWTRNCSYNGYDCDHITKFNTLKSRQNRRNFCNRHFQPRFPEWEYSNFGYNFIEFCSSWSALVRIKAVATHYLSQCWPRSMLPYGVTRPQCSNVCNTCNHCWSCNSNYLNKTLINREKTW